jgi:ribose transport system substrate-binding protein
MRTRTIAATLLLMASALAGCGGSDPAPAASDAPEAPSALRIAVIPKGLSHQFWLTVKAGAEAAGKEGGAEILWQGPAKETEIVRQINIVQDMINSRVDAIVMAACDATALIQPIDQALKAGIPVITIDSGVSSELPLSFVATDNIAAAKAGADKLVELIGGAGEVGVIPFVAGAGTSEMREQGFKEGIAAHPEVKIVATLYCDSDVAKAMNAAQDMMTANPNLKGIFAANEAAAIGAAQAIRSAGKAGQVKLVAFDGSEEEINGLKEGVIQALIVQRPFEMGHLGVKAALDAIAGKPVEKRIDTGVTIVTMDNFNEPDIQKLLNPLS